MASVHVQRAGKWGEPILFVHGSLSWGAATWAAQRPLAARWRLRFLDRRGFGLSEARAEGVDFDLDADDVAELLIAEPAHVVGHSYGGVVALLAAARAPRVVRSLTVIEPPAFRIARGDPAVERFIARMDAVWPLPVDATEEGFRAAFLGAMGFERTGAAMAIDSHIERRSIRASMTERRPEEARIPLARLRAAPFSKLVVCGAWDAAPAAARSAAGPALIKVACRLAEATGAAAAVFPGATHSPQLLGGPFNDRLERFLATGR